MTRWMLAGFMALVALAALGAAGAPAQADPPPNPFAGSWSGTWSHGEDEDKVIGTWDDWTISDAGRISGTFYSITNNFGGAVVGHVGADGKLMFIGLNGNPHQGMAWIGDNGVIVVSATGTWSGAWSFDGMLTRNN